MRKLVNKKIAAVAAGAIVVATAGVAYAYWTTTGSGEGSANVDSANGVLTLAASWNDNAIYPGGEQTVSFTASNPSETTLRLGTIELDSVDVVEAADAIGKCDVTDFTMEDVVANQSIETTVADGVDTPEPVAVDGTLKFANDSVNSQDACKGAEITLNISAADDYAAEQAESD